LRGGVILAMPSVGNRKSGGTLLSGVVVGTMNSAIANTESVIKLVTRA
jgi:hypothetical protein